MALTPEAQVKVELPDTSGGVDGMAHAVSNTPVHAKDNFSLPLESGQVTLDTVRNVIDCQNVEKLKAGVALARSILYQLLVPLEQSQQQVDQSEWSEKFHDLLSTRIEAARTVVAVVGSTGAGKSSLINSLLDEEEFLPTNGYRACTAVATEISYKECSNPKEAYSAEIEFCSKEDWEVELNKLLADLQDDYKDEDNDRGAGRAAWRDSESEAGKAYAKLRSVFPTVDYSSLIQADADDLLKDKKLQAILGTTKRVAYENAKDLAKVLSQYLESSEDTIGRDLYDGNTDVVEVWPLIKVVRVHCPAPALSTGLVIVDLPGFEDSNSVRSSIGYKYLSEANAIYIAAPIQRAVNDKTARDLLGKSFRIQMLMDNNISNVVFICTKIEDINYRESLKAHDKNHGIRDIFAKQQQLKEAISKIEDKYQTLERQVKDHKENLECKKLELNEWKKLEKKLRKGTSVSRNRIPYKRKRLEGSPSSDSEDGGNSTGPEIEKELAKLDQLVKEGRERYSTTQKEYSAATKQLAVLREQLAAAQMDGPRMCIQRRNADAINAIKWDFAMGIKEIDEDEPSGDQIDNGRNYDLISYSLPVHCISSYAYQQMKGRSVRQGAPIQGFKYLEDTGIPGLVEHGKNLTRSEEIMHHKSYLNAFLTLISSFAVLTASCRYFTSSASNNGRPAQLSAHDRAIEVKYIDERIAILKSDLSSELHQAKKDVQRELRSAIFYANSEPVKIATQAAANVVKSWSALERKGGYGIRLNTYKAICRRNGEKTGNSRARDFNADLLEKYLAAISRNWEVLFGTTIPRDVDRLGQIFREHVEKFHNDMSRRPVLKENRSGSLIFLAKNCKEYEMTIVHSIVAWKITLKSDQQQASRTFYPHIQAAMKPAYEKCTQISGKGAYKIINAHMEDWVTAKKTRVFKAVGKNALDKVEQSWDTFIQNFWNTMSELITGTIAQGYKTIVTAGEMTESLAIALGRCHTILTAVDSQFKEIMEGGQYTASDSWLKAFAAEQPFEFN